MAAIDTTRTTYGSASALSRVSNFLSALFGAIAAWNDARVTRKSLSALSDRELEDIGLIRGDIDDVALTNLIR